MKKVLMALAVVAAMTIVSCTDSKKDSKSAENAGENIEELAADTDLTDPTKLGEELAADLEANNGEGLKGKIEKAKEFAANLLKEGKGEQAKGIIEKIQGFLSENSDKVTSVIGDNEYVKGALDWVKNVNAGELLDKAGEALGVDNASEAAGAVKDAVESKATDAAGAAKETVESGKEKVSEAKDAVVEAGNAAIESAKEAVNEKGNEVVEKGKDAVSKGIDKVGGLLK